MGNNDPEGAKMIGAIIGDVIGSRFEGKTPPVSTAFDLFNKECRYTDDTVLTVAIANSILTGDAYEKSLRSFFNRYPHAGYGGSFKTWARDPLEMTNNSFGNGSAMRVSPIAWAFNDMNSVSCAAIQSAVMSHGHPEGIKGAVAIATSIFLAKNGASKAEIKDNVEKLGYPKIEGLPRIEGNHFATCQGTVPQAVWAFLESENFEDSIRKSIMIGGDVDTIACMAGSIAHAYYDDIPEYMVIKTLESLTEHLATITVDFMKKYVDKEFNYIIKQSEDAAKLDLFRSLFS